MSEPLDASSILVIDDDPIIARVLSRCLGIEAKEFLSSKDVNFEAETSEPKAIFIDIHLEDGATGLKFITEARAQWPYTPIIMVTGDQSDDVLERAFQLGADDLIRKPLKPKEVASRFLTRCTHYEEKFKKTTITVGDMCFDKAHRLISSDKGKVALSSVESCMLDLLISARGCVLPKEELKRRAWGLTYVTDNAFYRKLFQLRKTMKQVSQSVNLKSVYGYGIKLEVE